jgi:hypothetical protein
MICPWCKKVINYPRTGQKYHGECGDKARGKTYREKRKGIKSKLLPEIKQIMTDKEWYKSKNYLRLKKLSMGGTHDTI